MSAKVAKKLEKRPTVAIIGFGYAGLAVATELDASYQVVVISRQNYFFHNIGGC
jgi:aspartate oxidase